MIALHHTLTLIILTIALTTGANTVQFQRRGERGDLREEFHQTYPISGEARISLQNINGDVHIKVWDRAEVKVDAIKSARTQERLKEAEIIVEPASDAIKIRTKYPEYMRSRRDENGAYENPADVEYTLTVPRQSRLQNIELINGDFDAADYAGDVRVSAINGRITARGLTGEARLSTINGAVQVVYEQLINNKPINLSSVNGRVELTLPSDVNAEIRANTVHGPITNDFNLPVKRGEYVGRDLAGQLGNGDTHIRLNNVNGPVMIKRADDHKTISRVTNLLNEDLRNNNEHNEPFRREEVERAMRDAQQAEREVARAMRDSQREMQRQMARDMQREQRRMSVEMREAARDIERARPELEAMRNWGARVVDKQGKSFPVSGNTPQRVIVETFDGTVTVKAWDKPEVNCTIVKKASDQAEMDAMQITTEQRGNEIYLTAKHPQSNNYQSNSSVQFEVFVPARSNLRVSSGDGRLSVEGVNGEIDLKTGDGSIAVRNSGGRLRAVTGDGRLVVNDFDGAADVRTGDGRLLLEGRFTQLDAQTGDGPVMLGLPAGVNAVIETNAESVSHSEMYVAEDPNEEKRVRRWRVGNGGSNIWRIRTGDGRVVLGRPGNEE